MESSQTIWANVLILFPTDNIQKQLKRDPERKMLHQETLKIN